MVLSTAIAIGTAAAPWFGEWVTVEIAGAVLKGITTTVNLDEARRSLKVATIAAHDSQRGYGLLSGCVPDGRKGIQQFLGQFAAIGQVQRELQKPLCETGKPDADVLVAAFRKQLGEKGNEKIQANCKLDFLQAWMTVFVDSYFGEIQGIRFQVAKEQYLKQLAQRVDDIKFVGIAVAGDEVEKQEVLAQIFVMPDVREELRSNFRQADLFRSQLPRRTIPIRHGEPRPIAEGKFNPSEPPFKMPPLPYDWRNIDRQAELLEEQKEWAMRDRSSPRIPAQKVLNQTKNKAVLLGAPGSGKTTLASYFALMLTGKNDPTQIGFDANEDWLPVVVRIRDWVLQPGMGLLEYLRSYAEKSLAVKALPVGFFEHWLDRGKALILLDGLDEVVDEAQRRKVAEEIETFLHRYQENPAVITSRPAGYRWDFFNLDEFPHYTLEPFDEKQRDAFIEHWYDSRVADDKGKADRLKADLRKAFKGNDRIQKLAENPLLLTIIALIHRYQAELPRQRFKLYEKAVETLLTSWDSGKEIKLYGVLQYLKPDDLLYVLKKLAYWIHTQGNAGDVEGGTLIDKDELIQQLCKEIRNLRGCKQHEAKQEAERFVDFIQRRTGLLNEQGRDRYAFVHKTFQEYLTAEEITDRFVEGEDEVILDHIRDHLHDAHWREVLLLLVSKLKKKRAEKAIEAILNAGSDYEKWLHRDLLFAGWCLTEDPADLKTAAPELVGEILDRLVAIEVWDTERNGNKAREEVSKIIHRLSGTAFESEIWERLNDHAGTNDRFRLLEFQASLGLEEKAIEILLGLLKDDNSKVRSRAARSLGELGNTSTEVVSELLSLLKDNKPSVHSSAVSSLVQLGGASTEVISQLLSFLKGDNPGMRCIAAFSLGRLGNASTEVISGLLSFLKDGDSFARCIAASSLVQLGNASTEVISGLLSFLKDDDNLDRSTVTSSLAQLGNTSTEVVSELLSLLKDNDSSVRSSAAESLAQLGNTSTEVVSELFSLLKDDDSFVRSSAAASLVQLGNTSTEVVSELFSLLKDDDSFVRSSAAASLVQLGNMSTEVVSELLSLLKEDDSLACLRATLSLFQLSQKSELILPAVVQWIDRQPDDVPIGAAIDALWTMIE